MKILIISILISLSSSTFAQKVDKKYTISIHSISVNSGKKYDLIIVKNNNEVEFKYSLFDSTDFHLAKIDTAYIRLDQERMAMYKDTDIEKRFKILYAWNKVVEKYDVYHKDSVQFNLNSYPGYKRLLDSVAVGTNFSDNKNLVVMDGTQYSIIIHSRTISRTFQTHSPYENSNPTLYH